MTLYEHGPVAFFTDYDEGSETGAVGLLQHVVYQLAGHLRPITDRDELARIFARIVEVLHLPENPARVPQPVAVADLLRNSPLIEVTFHAESP